ncbi:MAG: hypothetical protein J6P84_05145 [Alphaproteobacteria bacterium]|nr:hypothetical protein [Alphaproteobacteria bacterium]
MSKTTLLDIQFDYIFERLFGIEKNKKLPISLISSIFEGNQGLSLEEVNEIKRKI